jgi:hypothetical protein
MDFDKENIPPNTGTATPTICNNNNCSRPVDNSDMKQCRQCREHRRKAQAEYRVRQREKKRKLDGTPAAGEACSVTGTQPLFLDSDEEIPASCIVSILVAPLL